MKANYKLANGTIIEVEVNDATAENLADFKKKERTKSRYERKHREVSISALFDESGWEPEDETVDLFATHITNENKKKLTAAIATLSEKRQYLIHLYYYKELTGAEIATIFGVSQQAISQQIETALKKLKKVLEKTL